MERQYKVWWMNGKSYEFSDWYFIRGYYPIEEARKMALDLSEKHPSNDEGWYSHIEIRDEDGATVEEIR